MSILKQKTIIKEITKIIRILILNALKSNSAKDKLFDKKFGKIVLKIIGKSIPLKPNMPFDIFNATSSEELLKNTKAKQITKKVKNQLKNLFNIMFVSFQK